MINVVVETCGAETKVTANDVQFAPILPAPLLRQEPLVHAKPTAKFELFGRPLAASIHLDRSRRQLRDRGRQAWDRRGW